MRSLITLDASKTRFHACENFNRCPHASADDVVYINPVTMGKIKWEQYRLLTESKLRSVQPVTVLVRPFPLITCRFFVSHTSQLVPLSRHSPLIELRAFVSLFRPARVVPNTLDLSLHGLDGLSIPNIFADCLSSPQSSSSTAFAEALVGDDIEIREDGGDSALQNLIGEDAERIAHAWADSGRGAEKLAVVEQFLTGPARDAARRALGLAPLLRECPDNNSNNNNGIERAVSILQRIRDKKRIEVCRRGAHSSIGESDQETESQDSDAHARMAKILFGLAGGDTQIMESASRVPTPSASERGCSRHVTQLDMRPLRTEDTRRAVRFADSEPGPSHPSRLITDASSPPSLTSPPSLNRGDSLLVPLARTKRQHPFSQSQSQSQSQPRAQSPSLPIIHSNSLKPGTKRQHALSQSQSQLQSQTQSQSSPSINSNVQKPSTKRRKLERLSTVPVAHEDAPSLPRKQVLSVAGAENITPAGLNANPTVLLDVDTDNRKAHRQVLRERSRAIEEKLRRALLVPSSTPPEKVL